MKRRLGDVIELQRRWIDVDPLATFEEIGVRSFGRGIFHKEPVSGHEIGNKRILRIEPGDLVFNNVFAWEGAVGLASEAERGKCGSHRFMTYTGRSDETDLGYLYYFFRSEEGVRLLGVASPGSAGRNRTLAIDRFEALEIPLPPIDEQRRIVAHLGRQLEWSEELAGRSVRPAAIANSLTRGARAAALSNAWSASTEARLEDVADVILGQSPPGHAYNETGEGLPLLNGPTEFGTTSPSPRQWTTTVTKECEPGDLLFSIRASIGRTNWADIRYCIGRGLAAIRARGGMDPHYLRHVLMERTDELREMAAGTTFLTLSGERLRSLAIPVPALETQQQIASRLDVLECRQAQLTSLVERRIAIARAFRSSALNHAFPPVS